MAILLFTCARFATLFAALAVIIMTTMAVTHLAATDAQADISISAHAGQMVHGAADDGRICDGHPSCAPDHAPGCEALCAGVVAFLPVPVESPERSYMPARHDRATAMAIAGRVPELRQRPPLPSEQARAASRAMPGRLCRTGPADA